MPVDLDRMMESCRRDQWRVGDLDWSRKPREMSREDETRIVQLFTDMSGIERLAGELTALQSTVARSNAHSTNDGYDVGAGTGQVPLNNGALNANLNADMLDGHHSGHAVGDVPVSDGVVCEELNADMLDGHHASAFVRVGAVVETTKTLTGKFMELVIGDQTYYLPLYQ